MKKCLIPIRAKKSNNSHDFGGRITARKASGVDQIASARELLRTAKTADELRMAQAV
jgi:hypothetical protein